MGVKIRALLVLVVFCAAGCVSEVKPLLKPVESDIPTRIANQQKWIDQDIALHALTREKAQPIQENLNRIKERYNKLQAQGTISPKDADALNRMLDDNSDRMFRAEPKRQKGTQPLEQF
jgi:hypothetical protein